MSVAVFGAEDLVPQFGATTVPRYERTMPPGFFVPRKRASELDAVPEAASPQSGRAPAAAGLAQSGVAASEHAAAALEAAMLRYALGDNSAFPDVYAQLAPRFHGFCVRLCAGRAEADGEAAGAGDMDGASDGVAGIAGDPEARSGRSAASKAGARVRTKVAVRW